MGGMTYIRLKDTSEENIKRQNARLRELKVRKYIRFNSEEFTKEEYEYYLKGDGNFPEHSFPKDKINSYEDFKRYWSPKALGEVFVPNYGTLRFDCYFGRTSKNAMHNVARYLLENIDEIKSRSGSYETFVERCGYKAKTKQKILLSVPSEY